MKRDYGILVLWFLMVLLLTEPIQMLCFGKVYLITHYALLIGAFVFWWALFIGWSVRKVSSN